MTTAKVLLVDDHAVLRQGLKALLSQEEDIQVVGEAENGHQALEKISELQPNVVVTDISMPGLNGIETTRRLRQKHPEIKVVVLSMHTDEEYVFQVLQAGAAGYVLKQSDSIEIVTAIRAVLGNGSFLSPMISQTVIEGYLHHTKTQDKQSSERPQLTSREREVLQLLGEGLANREIAAYLNISVKTVESHRTNMMNKLEVKNKTELIKYALRKGWVMLEE